MSYLDLGVRVYNYIYLTGTKFTILQTKKAFVSCPFHTQKNHTQDRLESKTRIEYIKKCKRLFFPRMILAFTQRTMFLL